jgi:elongation factor G
VEPDDQTQAVSVTLPTKANVPPNVFAALREAIEGAASSGALCGYPIVNMKAAVKDFSFDASSIDDVTYKVAASNALRAALQEAKPNMMEPVMRVEIVVPPESSGTIVSDVASRRGHVNGMESRGHLQVVLAQIPLAELFGYETDIRSLSQGRASSTMHFSHYQPLTKALQDKVMGLA